MIMLSTIASRIDIVTGEGGRIPILQKVSDARSTFAPKRQFIQQVIDRALTDMLARQGRAPDACLCGCPRSAQMTFQTFAARRASRAVALWRPNVELKLTALLLGGGWLAPLACRTVDGAPQLNSGALGG